MRRLFEDENFTLKKYKFYEDYRTALLVSRMIKTDLAKTGRKFAFKQIYFSFVLLITCTVITFFIWGLFNAKSVLTGGLVVIIPNIFFALKAFRYAGARSSKKVLESFYSGEKMKIVLMAILLALAFKLLAIEPVSFFTSFCLVMAIPFLTPFLFRI